jgi:N-acetylmuramoyl-L-alanine amidase
MGNIYLDWLPDAVGAALDPMGYKWQVFDDDWLYRARSSGGYDSLPLCVMWHHTASNGDAWSDANYQCYSSPDRPISNITIDENVCLILAGGATNTNGSGSNSPMKFSRGTVEEDNMNRRAVGIEMCNNGVGEVYPSRLIDAMIAVSNSVNAWCGNQPTDVMTHQGYAPERKVDPATAAAVQGGWRPRSCTSSGSWNVSDLQTECKRRATAPGPAPDRRWLASIDDEGDTMFIAEKDGKYWIGNGLGRRVCDDNAEADFLIEKFRIAGHPLINFQSGNPVDSRSDVAGAKQMDQLGVNVGSD